MDKIVLITGASSGIGEGCARKFASEGAKLILNARSVDKLEALAADLKEKYGTERMCFRLMYVTERQHQRLWLLCRKHGKVLTC